MRRRVLLCLSVGFLLAGGCASGPCNDGASAQNAIANKFSQCSADESGFFGGFSPCYDVQACETNLKSCTAADQKVLEATAACQNAYASNSDCSFAGLTTYNNCALAATTSADGGSALSAACAAAFANNQGTCATDAGQ